ncbi:MAG: M60 family peptidase N-terminal accessory domain-containing protein [Bacteroidota bacterium]
MRRFHFLYGLILLFSNVNLIFGQIIDLDFNNSVVDSSANDHTVTYVVNNTTTSASEIVYSDGIEDRAIVLDNVSAIALPLEVTGQVFSSNVWVIQTTFMVTEWGDGFGGRMLFNHQAIDGNPRWFMDIGKLDDESGDMTFFMNDGNVDISGTVGDFSLNEWVSITVTIDFDEEYWTVSSDGFFNTRDFSGDGFDYGLMKDDGSSDPLNGAPIYIGNNRFDDDFESGLIVDNFTITNEVEVDLDDYKSNLVSLTNYLSGTNSSLTDDEVSIISNSIISSHPGNYLDAKAEVDDFLSAYEDAKPPLFESHEKIDFYNHYEPIDWVSFVLKIDLFNNYFEPGTFDQVDEYKFEEAEIYPGPVSESAERVINAMVTVDGTYLADPGYTLNEQEKGVLRPTGYYAAPGEMVTISVDNAHVNEGLEIVVGSQTWDLSRWYASLNRFPIISKTFKLNATEITVANPFGGSIYLQVPLDTEAGILDITINNAIKAPFYSSLEHNATSSAEWRTEVEKGDVQWMDWESEYMLITLPSHFEHYDLDDGKIAVDPEPIMARYDSMWMVFQQFSGRPMEKSRSEYFQTDRRIPFGFFGSGYPMVVDEDRAPEEFCSGCPGFNLGHHPYHLFNESSLREDRNSYSIILHELGHNMDMPTLNGELEAIVELNFAMMLSYVGALPADSAFKYASEGHLTIQQTIVDWVISKNFREGNEIGYDELGDVDEISYQHIGWAKYFELGRLLGWDFLGNGHKVFYQESIAAGDPPDVDFITGEEFIEVMCVENNLNVAPLIHFWGYHPSEDLINQVNQLPKSQEIYERLIFYRSTIPQSLQEFQPYYNALSDDNDYNGRAGDPHFVKYDSALVYFEQFDYESQMIARMDSILEIYYDRDFDGDGILFYEDCDDTDPLNEPITESISISSCDSYEFNGEVLTMSGDYQAMLQTTNGCDSLVNLDLTIHFSEEVNTEIEACDFYEFDGGSLTSSGDYQGVFQNSDGCDSLVNISLTIHPNEEVEQEIIVEESYEFDGQILNKSGEYIGVYTNRFGCDSTVTLTLIIEPPLSTSSLDQLVIFPNPVTDRVWINGLKTESTISILDSSGRILFMTKSTTEQTSIPMDFGSGIYIISIESSQGSRKIKVRLE